ncbi:hypothetical protein NLU13_8295 [Sarocladium strictum]|uniref:COP9 signalosome complex subunit 12 n=1 Tax=Sarocladium strictum TaxID=5046 RepID=A0AA39GDR2_SARSR|nr:hypothetical protein NLU13_8295 [Sarocladium strictum]
MNELFAAFAAACASEDGYALAQTFTPIAPPSNPRYLWQIRQSTNLHTAKSDIKHFLTTSLKSQRNKGVTNDEIKGWVDVYEAYWKALGEITAGETGKSSWTKVYESWRDLTSTLVRGYNQFNFPAWTVPSLYVIGKYLRLFAIRSDAERSRGASLPATGASLMQDDFDPESEKQAQLRDCEQHLKRIFTLCLNDRAELHESRKWGIYYVINLLFKTYFKLNSASLSRTILKTLAVYKDKGDMPPLEAFPKSHRVTFKYYEGVLFFLEENYIEAEKHLTEAWNLCLSQQKSNLERILTYLIPCRLLTAHVLPTQAFLEPFPRLQRLFLPLARSVRNGDLRGFDQAVLNGEDFFVKRRIYLTLERSRDIALRNLLRKVFIAGGFEDPKEPGAAPVRRTRVPVAEFQAAISMSSGGSAMDTDEVECLLANMIYKVMSPLSCCEMLPAQC